MKKIKFLLLMICVLLFTGCSKEKGGIDLKTCSFEEYQKYFASYIEVGNYNDISYNYTDAKATSAEIQAYIDAFLIDVNACTFDKTSLVKMGDLVNIDFVGSIDGVEFEGGSGENFDLSIGSGTFIDGFEEQILDHKGGDEFDVVVTFPEDYGVDELNGKEAVFKTKVNYIYVADRDKFNDELVSKNTEYKTAQDYRNAIKEQILSTKNAEARGNAQSAIINEVFNACTVKSVDETIINANKDEIINSIKDTASVYQMEYLTYIQQGYDMESIEEFENYVYSISKKDFEEKAFICAIAIDNDITISEEDKQKQIETLANTYNIKAEDVTTTYTDNEISYFALESKVINFLFDKATQK
jgi:trigger factor